MSNKAIVIGGGRQAVCVIDALTGSSFELIGCIDSVKPIGHEVLNGIKVLGAIEEGVSWLTRGVTHAFMGVGGATNNQGRADLFERFCSLGFQIPSVIHPEAFIAESSVVGPGSVVLAKASIGPLCTVGANVIVNQGSTICHHCVVGDHAHIAPGAVLSGGVQIGVGATVGMCATIYLDIQVGDWSLIHNGVQIVRHVPPHTEIRNTVRISSI